MLTFENWNKSATSRPARVVVPTSVDELVEVVQNPAEYPSPVRAAGHLHSTTPCIEADGGTQVFMRHFTDIRTENGGDRIIVGAGVTMLQIRDALRPRRELPVSPEIGNATAGSVACSGSKDSTLRARSGPGFAQISSAVVKVRMVDANGDVLVVDTHGARLDSGGAPKWSPTLSLVRCSYGLLGIIFEVEFETTELRPLQSRFVSLPVADRFDPVRPEDGRIYVPNVPEIFDGADAVLAFLQPYEGRILAERRTIAIDGVLPTAADRFRRSVRDWIWEWGATEATTWFTGLADVLSGDQAALRTLLATGLESALAGSADGPWRQMLPPAAHATEVPLAPLVDPMLDSVARLVRDSAAQPDTPLSTALLALFDRLPQPVLETVLGGYRAYRSDSLVDFTDRRATFFDFTFWAFPQTHWDGIVERYIRFCRRYTTDHGMYRPALFTEVYFICKDTHSLLSFSRDEPVFTLDMVDNRPTDPRWKAMNEAFNEWAVREGGQPLLNQTKQLDVNPEWVRGAYGERWNRFSADVWTANRSADGRFVSAYFKKLLSAPPP